MSANESKKKKAKKPKCRTSGGITSEASSSRPTGDGNINHVAGSCIPLLAKDSEWVDILQTPPRAMCSESTEEIEMEDGPEQKPLAIMFPGLLEKDPQTLQDMLTKAMSTSDVTKHLVDLGQKANFTYMKKANRLIPPDKEWLDSVSEVNAESNASMGPAGVSGSSNNEYYNTTETKKNQDFEENQDKR